MGTSASRCASARSRGSSGGTPGCWSPPTSRPAASAATAPELAGLAPDHAKLGSSPRREDVLRGSRLREEEPLTERTPTVGEEPPLALRLDPLSNGSHPEVVGEPDHRRHHALGVV